MAQAAAMAKRSWWIDKHHVLHCYSSSRADCRVTSLVDLPEISDFYDPELGRATEEINRVFAGLAERRRPYVEPSVIVVERRPLLAWTLPSRVGPDEDGAVGPSHDPDTIRQALRLKAGKGGTGHRRSWIMVDKKVWCYANPAGNCVVSRFWEPDAEEGSFHDADLAAATKEINATLDAIRAIKDRRGEPSFVSVDDALLLVRTEPATVGPDDEPHLIRRALGVSD